MRGETGSMPSESVAASAISIHSPHARGDGMTARYSATKFYFNPLPSCEGRRGRHVVGPPARYFNPLPSCEGRPGLFAEISVSQTISIHSPHARGDPHHADSLRHHTISIHSPHARGDRVRPCDNIKISISIHSPHARGDQARSLCRCFTIHFNPLPSCEGRHPHTGG